jgi:hypothetical protein
MLVVAGLDPAIHHLRKTMDARVKPAHDVERARKKLKEGVHEFSL